MYNNEYEAYAGILGAFALFGTIVSILSLAIGVVMLVSLWKIYKKAGKKGWESIIPIYNMVVLIQIAELPMWYIILFFIPLANLFAIFKIYIELAHKFGKSTGFGVASVFFSYICLPILAFGKNNVYKGNGTSMQTAENQVNNQYNIPSPLQTGINNLDNNAPVTSMFNQNIDTHINSVQNAPEINSIQNNEPVVATTPQTEQPLNVIPSMPNTESVPNNVVTQNQEVTTNQTGSFVYNPNGMNTQNTTTQSVETVQNLNMPQEPTVVPQPQVVNQNVSVASPMITGQTPNIQPNNQTSQQNVMPNVIPTQNNNPINNSNV